MPYRRESAMYPSVRRWLETALRSRFPGSEVHSADVHRLPLHRWLRQTGLARFFPSDLWRTFDIQVDIAAVIIRPSETGLALVECKLHPITLRDLSQLLGYARVALPLCAFLCSPSGFSTAVQALLETYGRWDVLEYHRERGQEPRRLVLARWNSHTGAPDAGSVLPPGAL